MKKKSPAMSREMLRSRVRMMFVSWSKGRVGRRMRTTETMNSDIHAPTKIAEDAAWSAALATYISVYRYKGVLWLFEKFNRSIAPDSSAFKSFLAGTPDKELAQALRKAAEEAASG